MKDITIDDGMIDKPLAPDEAKKVQIVRAPTIVKPPAAPKPPEELAGPVLLHCGDKITTDHIMPAGAYLKLRSNVPEYAKVVFDCFTEPGKGSFADRAMAARDAGKHGVIVAGDSYGQGSSREHAALCPMYLGVRLVIAKTIERIHRANLVNFAIAPATFADAADYDRVKAGDELTVTGFAQALKDSKTLEVTDVTGEFSFKVNLELSDRERAILTAGGKLNFTKEQDVQLGKKRSGKR